MQSCHDLTKRFRLVVPGLILSLSGLVSCQHSSSSKSPTSAVVETSTHENAATDASQPPPGSESRSFDDPSSTFVEQQLVQLGSPFTRETVLTLNAIVARSLSTINAFDDAREQLDASDRASAAEMLTMFHLLADQAALARQDMDAAAERLRNSGEPYNEAIFAAMVHFVDDVDEEIRAEIEQLSDVQVLGAE
jgi:hypothetical protein